MISPLPPGVVILANTPARAPPDGFASSSRTTIGSEPRNWPTGFRRIGCTAPWIAMPKMLPGVRGFGQSYHWVHRSRWNTPPIWRFPLHRHSWPPTNARPTVGAERQSGAGRQLPRGRSRHTVVAVELDAGPIMIGYVFREEIAKSGNQHRCPTSGTVDTRMIMPSHTSRLPPWGHHTSCPKRTLRRFADLLSR